MAIKVMIKRKFKPGHLSEVSALLNKIRYGAMGQRGYVSSETLSGHTDLNKILVVSMWQEMVHWERWKNSEQRKSVEADIERLLDGPAEYEVYDLGMQNS